MMQKGIALVLVGGGNAYKARLIARRGKYVEIPARELGSRFKIWLTADVRTVIVHGWVPLHPSAAAELKAMIAGDTIKVERQHTPAEFMRAPNFIFCVNREDAFRFDGDRRYNVVHLEALK